MMAKVPIKVGSREYHLIVLNDELSAGTGWYVPAFERLHLDLRDGVTLLFHPTTPALVQSTPTDAVAHWLSACEVELRSYAHSNRAIHPSCPSAGYDASALVFDRIAAECRAARVLLLSASSHP